MKQIFIVLILALSWAIAKAQVPSAPAGQPRDRNLFATELAERLDVIAKKALARPVAGVSIAVARDGEVVFARGYGMANLEDEVAVTPSTVFHIASISKNILAAVVLQLVDRGKLRLDDDVTKYVPEAPTQGGTLPCGNY